MIRTIPRQRVTNYEGKIRILGSILTRRFKKGENIKKFEEEFARYIGVKYAITVNSGRLALYLILKANNFKKGDEIILPAYNYYVIPEIIQMLGLIPVFVDVNKETFTLDLSLIENSITDKTKAIILTHVFGQPCDMKKAVLIAKKYNLKVIEDCAHALGSEYNGKKVGSFGTGIFSFVVTKHINTFGSGMVATNGGISYKKIRNEINKYVCPSYSQAIRMILKSLVLSIFTTPIIFSIFVYPLILIFSTLNIDFGPEKVKLVKIKIRYHKQKFLNIQAVAELKWLTQLEALNQKMESIEKFYISILKNSIRVQQSFKKTNLIICCLVRGMIIGTKSLNIYFGEE